MANFLKKLQNKINFIKFLANGAKIDHAEFQAEVNKALEEQADHQDFKCVVAFTPYDVVGYNASKMECIMASVYAGLTAPTEIGVKEDVVVICYHNLRWSWYGAGNTWQEAVRAIVRHEYRHVQQIKELRRRGGSDFVIKAFKAHGKVSPFYGYKTDPMEKDAFGNQNLAPANQSSIKEAVDEIIANF